VRPKQASDAFERITKYIKDNFLMTAAKVEALQKRAEEVGERQASINRRLFTLSQADLESIRDSAGKNTVGHGSASLGREGPFPRDHVSWRGNGHAGP